MAETGLRSESPSSRLWPRYQVVSFTNVQDELEHPDPNTAAKRAVSRSFRRRSIYFQSMDPSRRLQNLAAETTLQKDHLKPGGLGGRERSDANTPSVASAQDAPSEPRFPPRTQREIARSKGESEGMRLQWLPQATMKSVHEMHVCRCARVHTQCTHTHTCAVHTHIV